MKTVSERLMLTLVTGSLVVLPIWGCMLLGSAAGSKIPRWSGPVSPASGIQPGEEVELVLTEPAGIASSPAWLSQDTDAAMFSGAKAETTPLRARMAYRGTLRGIESGDMVLDDGSGGTRRIAISNVREARIREGSYWREGMALGVAVDAVAVILLLSAEEDSVPFEGGLR